MYENNYDYEPYGSNNQYSEPPVREPGTGLAKASLIFGLISFFGLVMGGFPITGTIATVLGLSHIKRNRDKRLFAILGIVLGISGIIISVVLLNIVMGNLLPSTEDDITDIYRIINQYSV